jgi:hypothetical protein
LILNTRPLIRVNEWLVGQQLVPQHWAETVIDIGLVDVHKVVLQFDLIRQV